MNLYAYCGSNPLNRRDPSGNLEEWLPPYGGYDPYPSYDAYDDGLKYYGAWWAGIVGLTGDICGVIVDNYGPYSSHVIDMTTGAVGLFASPAIAGLGGPAAGYLAAQEGMTSMIVGFCNILFVATDNETTPASTTFTIAATYLFGDNVAEYVEVAENLVLGPYTFWVRLKAGQQISDAEVIYEILQLTDDGEWEVIAESTGYITLCEDMKKGHP